MWMVDWVSRLQQLLFPRQHLAELLQLPDDLLSYWIKEGLLVANSGGGGKGRHRLFSYEQLHIAGVLKELRRYGVSTNTLRAISQKLQQVLEVVRAHSDLTETDILDARAYMRMREAFAADEPSAELLDRRLGYESFEEWFEERQAGKIRLSERGIRYADDYDDGVRRAFALHGELFGDDALRVPVTWFVNLDDIDAGLIVTVEAGDELPSERASYIALNLGKIIHALWTRK